MKQTFQSAVKFFGCLLITLMLSNALYAQSSGNHEGTLQVVSAPTTMVVESTTKTPVYHGGTATNTGSQVQSEPKVQDGNVQYMGQTPAGTNSYKTDNGMVTINNDGSVTTTTISATGGAKTTTVSKPIMNLSQPMGYEMDAYIAQYQLWMKSNPDFMNFISATEKNLISQGDFSSIYKNNYLVSQKLSHTK